MGFSDSVRKRKYQVSHSIEEGFELSREGWNRKHVSTLSERPTRKESKTVTGIELKSLILAQIERWRHALHMQVERQHGGNPGGEWRTGE